MKLPRRRMFVRVLIMLVVIGVVPVVAVVATRTNIEQESLTAEAASGVTDITSIVSSGSAFSYGSQSCGGQTCKQLQGFTVTDDKMVFYLENNNVGNINAYTGSSFQTQANVRYATNLGHGNDMTYNTQTGKVLVIGPDSYKGVAVLNSSTLATEKTVSVDDTWAIGYDEFNNYYVLLQNKIWLVDENFTKKKSFSYSIDGNVSQGMEYHNGYVYHTVDNWDSNLGGEIAYIYVYKAKLKTDGSAEVGFGDRVATYYINASALGDSHYEIESISFRNNKAYIGFANSTLGVAKISSFSDNNVEVPLSTTIKYTNNKHSTKVTVTGTDQLKSRSGYTLSDDGYSLSKTVEAASISESTKFCDNYNNCVTLDLSHTNSSYVEQQSQTVSFANASVTKTYGDAAFTNAATTTGDGAITYTSSNTGVATVSSSGKVTIKSAGTVTITATAAETDNYTSASKSYTLTINKANQTVSFANASVTKTYGDAAFTNAATTTGDGAISYVSSNTNVVTVNSSTGVVTIKGVGSAQITATAAGTGNYNSASKIYTVTVNKANQTVSFANASVTKTYGDAAFTNVAVTTGDGAITYGSSNNNIATVDSNGKVTIRAAGTVTITATAAATNNYNSASKEYTLMVGNASQILSFSNTSNNITVDYGVGFSNQATSTNSAATITYASSDTNVATVDNNGKITTKKSGKVTITATAVAENYNSASKSYNLNVRYKLSFDVNGGEGSVAPETCVASDNSLSFCDVTVPEANLNREGYYFLGWALDGAATAHANNAKDVIELSDNQVFYAIWAPIYTLVFDLNMDVSDEVAVDDEVADELEGDVSEDGETEDVAEDGTEGEELTVEAQTCHPDTTDGTCSVFIPFTDFTREGYEFFGWAKTATAVSTDYLSGQKFTFATGEYNEVLYALWADGDIVWMQGTEYTLGSGKDMVFRINFPLNHFESLTMDGEEVSEDNYRLDEGSTIVTLRASYLDSLDAGEHELVVAYDNGATATTRFEIAEKIVAPDTGGATSDSGSNVVFVTCVAPIILLAIYIVVRVWKNKTMCRKFD